MATLAELIEAFTTLVEYLGDMLNHLVHAFLYPIQAAINFVIDMMMWVINIFVSLVAAIYSLCSSITSLFTEFLTDLMPDLWVVLLILGILIAFIQRVYFYLKDISIFGWKI